MRKLFSRRRRTNTRRLVRGLLIALAIVVVVGIGILTYSQTLQVTRYTVSTPNLPHGDDGLRIVQISDLHRRQAVPDMFIRSAVAAAQREKPDLVVLTGDFVSFGKGNAQACAELLAPLKARFGVYAVMGNHDHWENAAEVTRALEGVGVKVLTNRNVKIAGGIYLVGLDDLWSGKPDFVKAWRGVPENTAQVLLCHNPQPEKITPHKCLMISGHTHGGQLNIPGVARNTLPGLRNARYVEGWYKTGGVRMYVNRGIGKVNPPIRLFCRPEVTVYALSSNPNDTISYKQPEPVNGEKTLLCRITVKLYKLAVLIKKAVT